MSDLSPGGRAFFEATRRLDEPSDADRQRIREKTIAAIAAAGAAGTVATKAAATAAVQAVAPAAVAAGWGGAAVTGAVLAVAVLVGQSAIDVATGHDWLGRPVVSAAPSARGPSTAVAHLSGETRENPDARPGTATPTRGKALDESTTQKDGPLPSPPRPAPRPGPSVAPEPSAVPATPPVAAASAMDEEIAALREAQESLRAGKPDEAVRVLDRYEATHTGVALEEERRAARIVAACKAGGATRSTADAERFLRERPDSPLAERVRAACSDKATP